MLSIFLDIETTGLDPQKHVVIDLAFEIHDKDKGEVCSYQSLVKRSLEEWELADPTSLSINGYTFEECLKGKEKELVAKEILELFNFCGVTRENTVFICQNPAFDRIFFAQIVDFSTQEKYKLPYHWLDLGSMVWALYTQKQALSPSRIPLSKNAIAEAYGIPPEEEPHRAMGGVRHLVECYKKIFTKKTP
jgi:oligoribonuclease